MILMRSGQPRPEPPERREGIIWPDGREVSAQVRHQAKSLSTSLRVSSIYEDYSVPWISHCLDVEALCLDSGICGREPDDPKHWCETEFKVARLVVNEFPVHMIEDSRDSVASLFDACELGPTDALGLMVDNLGEAGEFNLYNPVGAVLHLQNLEVRPDLRRQGLGSQLVRYAIALLGRAEQDLVVCELIPSTCVYPRLGAEDDDLVWSKKSELIAFLRENGFERYGVNLPVPAYYQVIDAETRMDFLT